MKEPWSLGDLYMYYFLLAVIFGFAWDWAKMIYAWCREQAIIEEQQQQNVEKQA